MNPLKNVFFFEPPMVYLFILSLSVGAWFFPVSPSVADSDDSTSLTITADKQFEFAEYYYANGDFERAIDEYHRFIYFFPTDARTELVRYKIGMSHLNNRQFKKALISFKALIEKYGDSPLSIKSYYRISESHLALGNPASALATLNHLSSVSTDPDIRDEAFYRMGWIYLEMGKWKNARSVFENIGKQNRHKYRLEHLFNELAKKGRIKKKDPQAAGLLSLLPGAGYLYVGRYRDALIAFLLNGGLIYAAYESFEDDHPAFGGLISLVGLGFYAGNIYGSIASAHKYNRTKTNNFIQRLKQNSKVHLSAGFNRSSIRLSFHYVF